MVPLIAKTSRWLVFNKPAGWLTIPGRSLPGVPVLSEWVQENFGRVWVVHRLDLETSGVILFARTEEAHRVANGWFSTHKVRKKYDCLCSRGTVAANPVFRLDQPIEGARCVTQVEVRERYTHGEFLAFASPLTGRRHQIRIHLSGAGHPLLGDSRYGGPKTIAELPELEIGRVALHAARLELPPEAGEPGPAGTSKEQRIFEAPWPEDFERWVQGFRKK